MLQKRLFTKDSTSEINELALIPETINNKKNFEL